MFAVDPCKKKSESYTSRDVHWELANHVCQATVCLQSQNDNVIIFAQLYLALWIKTAHFLQKMENFVLTNWYPPAS